MSQGMKTKLTMIDLARYRRQADLRRLQRTVEDMRMDRAGDDMFDDPLAPAVGVIRAVGWGIVAICFALLYWMEPIVRMLLS